VMLTYAAGAGLAAMAGVLAAPIIQITPLMGSNLIIVVFAVVVIGGTLLAGGRGHMIGTLLGLLVFGTIQTALLFDGRLSSWWIRIVVGLLLLVFILLQRGLLRGASGKK